MTFKNGLPIFSLFLLLSFFFVVVIVVVFCLLFFELFFFLFEFFLFFFRFFFSCLLFIKLLGNVYALILIFIVSCRLDESCFA